MTRGLVAWCLALAAMLAVGALSARAAVPAPVEPVAAMHRIYTLRYVPHTILCRRSQLGADGLVYGDGPKPFPVVCEHDGPYIDAWDAEPW